MANVWYVTSNSQNDLVFYLWHHYLSLELTLPSLSPILAWIIWYPLFVRNVFCNKDEPLYKVFIVVYTCVRRTAIRLDKVPDASCSSFTGSSKLFIPVNGVVDLYISDNAKCFTGQGLGDYLSTLSISLRYKLEVSPWWRGVLEWMVQVVKGSLRKFLPKSKLTYEELLTVIFEIKSFANSRPLCYVYDNSIEKVITSPHLLLGRHILTKFNSDFNENNIDSNALSGWAHYLQTLIDHYWNRWRREYLSELRERHKLTNVFPDCQNKLKEVVIIEETHALKSR